MIRFTDGPASGKGVLLKRAPLFLRVVFDPQRKKWDALDQLTDTPALHESIFVYRRVGSSSAMMLDWTERGRRRGGRFAVATYAHVAEQLDDATVRDTAKWREWCWSQVRPTPTGDMIEEARRNG